MSSWTRLNQYWYRVARPPYSSYRNDIQIFVPLIISHVSFCLIDSFLTHDPCNALRLKLIFLSEKMTMIESESVFFDQDIINQESREDKIFLIIERHCLTNSYGRVVYELSNKSFKEFSEIFVSKIWKIAPFRYFSSRPPVVRDLKYHSSAMNEMLFRWDMILDLLIDKMKIIFPIVPINFFVSWYRKNVRVIK